MNQLCILQTTCHPRDKYHVLIGKQCKPIPRQDVINRPDYILPFVCNHGTLSSCYNVFIMTNILNEIIVKKNIIFLDCGKFFYVPETFILHLKTVHTSSPSIFKCHLCNATCSTIKSFMSVSISLDT